MFESQVSTTTELLAGAEARALADLQWEACDLLAEAVLLAQRLGFSIIVDRGKKIKVTAARQEPLLHERGMHGSECVPVRFYEAESLAALIAWLEGVEFGRTNGVSV